jgi:lysophospholipase L1-like esterase
MKILFALILTITALAGCAKKTIEVPAADNAVKTGTPKTDTPKTTPTDTTKTNPPVIKFTASVTQTSNSPGLPVAGSLNYLALGDSYTIGQSVPIEQSFPYQLAAQLKASIKINTPTIVATTGWTTANLINALSTDGGVKSYDFVTLLIGVNDQFRSVGEVSYRAAFIEILKQAIAFAHNTKSRVFVLSIPDYGVTPYAGNDKLISDQINAFNAINKYESTKAGVNYLDITDISRQAATDPTLLAPDDLHPSGKMYSLWVQRLAPMVKAQLEK